jgi:lipoprotein-anchoring transpeptidase ErfK/SrfK
MGQKTNKPDQIPEANEPRHRRFIRDMLFVAAAIAFIAAAAGLFWFYNNRALPNVSVGSVHVGNAPEDQIKKAVEQLSTTKLTFIDGNDTRTVPLTEIGVKVNIDATVNKVLQARRSKDPIQDLQIWQTKNVPLVFDNDPGKLKEFLQEHYPSLFIDAKDAQLTYDITSHKFIIQPGTDGRGFDLRSLEASLPQLAAEPRDIKLSVATAPVKPLIQEDGLSKAQKDANNRISLGVNLTINGNTVFKANPDDIANWIHVIPDVITGTASLEFDTAKIQQYLTDTASPKLAKPPVDRKVVIDKKSGDENVISAGSDGFTIKDADIVAGYIAKSLTSGKAIDQEVEITAAPFKTITMTGYGKWIEVDLSRQTTTMYIGDTPIRTFVISSGKARTPTSIGESKIYKKYKMKTMTGTLLGEYYYVPDIPWVMFFNGGEAFHGTYWHSNFGHPMSHGCINMRIAEAKILYDFAPVGTKVIVHR